MTTLNETSSCVAQYDAQAMPVSAVQAIVREWATPVTTVERVHLRDALNRVLAQDIVSPIDVPAHDNSAMDGYAFAGAALEVRTGVPDEKRELVLSVAGKAFAGHPFAGSIERTQCVRVMTGATMPAGCDTVVPQEAVTRDGDTIRFAASPLRTGANRRLAGEDLAQGAVALKAGRIVRASDLGLLASLGIGEVSVRRRLRVAFFSTGDELRSIGQPLDPGCVYDSNRYTLFAMLKRLDVDPIDLGVVRDEPAALEEALRTAASSADVVITSGGVSVGEADLTKQMLRMLGDVAHWSLAMRPGRPLAFGRIWSGGKPGAGEPAIFFGLPGNPVAVMAAFYQIVREVLLRMSGATTHPVPLIRAACVDAIRKRPGRTEFQRGIAQRDAQGTWRVTPTGSQGSGVLSSMSEANCFIVLAHDQGDLDPGDAVDIMLFDGLI
ncbi:molybdopterin molybdotransferase MoeA [Paraburkholderia caribensis]|uniref:Molybdopterin molybdenumtransferase n=1 Tax=Paraburkholderia caribensis TaxID=75105 RepID=A0A9Q6RYV1_9BURK|nr:gephyrin-like molybdotransferase Glp [Paraburkholderia caribensis]MCO4878033.1 molybdopterin-binding protein [Paraburkholderia caribensis]PTB27269.1 molybdopterin molybdenumtransferase MoeA [Paraburkholderia caribensis]QLB61705.1 molybdopterin molybdenumtransferase MoeA [Paraburkholderia caribensis]